MRKGAFGSVYLCKKGENKYAIKIIPVEALREKGKMSGIICFSKKERIFIRGKRISSATLRKSRYRKS
jgi:hypothetical protein